MSKTDQEVTARPRSHIQPYTVTCALTMLSIESMKKNASDHFFVATQQRRLLTLPRLPDAEHTFSLLPCLSLTAAVHPLCWTALLRSKDLAGNESSVTCCYRLCSFMSRAGNGGCRCRLCNFGVAPTVGLVRLPPSPLLSIQKASLIDR